MMKESLVVNWISSLTSVLDEFSKIDLNKVTETPIYSSQLKDLAKLLNRTYEEADHLLRLKENQLRDELLACFETHQLELSLKRECSFCYGIYLEATKIGRVFLNDGRYEVFPMLLKEEYSQISIKDQEGILVSCEEESESRQIEVSLGIDESMLTQVEENHSNELKKLNEDLNGLIHKRIEVADMQWKNQWHQLTKESFKAITKKEDVLKGYDACIENLKVEIRAYQAMLHRISGLKNQTLDGQLLDELKMKRVLAQLFEKTLKFTPRK